MAPTDAASEQPVDPGAVPILGAAGAGLRFELVLNPAEGEEDPFVALSDTGRFSRVLLGRIAMGENTTLRSLAFKLQRSSYRPAGEGALPIANPQIDEQWARERKNLLAMPADEETVVRLLDFGDARARSKPVTFCRKVRKYFHPPCPACGKLLEDCRDEALLREFGLSSYAGTTTRYLACRACTDAGGKTTAVFYTYATGPEEQPKGSVTLRRRSELYRDFEGLVRSKNAPAHFPCASCEHRESCYPSKSNEGEAIPAEKLLFPLSYYEFASLPLEFLDLHYDEFIDLVGGASRAAVKENASPGRAPLLAPLDAGFSGRFQWAFRGDAGGLFAVEVLRLKMIAFTQLCRGLKALHTRAKQPHLDLNPSNVMVSIPPPSPDLPARWNFKAKLLDLGAPQLFPPAAPLGGAFLPPPDFHATYASPIVRQTASGREEPMRAVIRNFKPEGKGMRVEVDLTSDRVKLHEYCVRDIVRILPTSWVSWLENASLWGTITGTIERGLKASALLSTTVENVKTPVPFEARVAFYKRFHVPCDLYSVGMLLLRTLFVNDAQDMIAVEEAAERVLSKLSISLQDRGTSEYAFVANSLYWLLDAEKNVFNKTSVVYAKEDREGSQSAIPDGLWNDLVQIAFRLISNIPAFSFAANHGDYDPAKPEAKMEEVLAAVDSINARLHVELFGRTARDQEIAGLCAELIAEMSGAREEGEMERADFSG